MVLIWATWIVTRRGVWRQEFRKAGAMAEGDSKVTFVIDDSRIRKITAGMESSWIWELVPSIVGGRGGYLIEDGAQAHWLPDHAFADERDRDEFAALAQRRAAKFVSRGRETKPDAFS